MLMGVGMGLGLAALPESWVPSDGITTMAEHFGSALLVVGFMFWMLPSWTSEGQLKKALDLLAKGKAVDYEGATAVNFTDVGEAFGSFLEKEVKGGKFKTKKQR